MKKYLYTVTYIDKNNYLQWFDIKVESWKEIGSQITCHIKDDIRYIVSIRYDGVFSEDKEN